MKRRRFVSWLTLVPTAGLLTACGASETATPTPDPYKNMSAKEFATTFVKLYMDGKYGECQRQFSKMSYFKSPDDIELSAKANRKLYGKVREWRLTEEVEKPEINFSVLYFYEGDKFERPRAADLKIIREDGRWRCAGFVTF
jgi:hypothetical protein